MIHSFGLSSGAVIDLKQIINDKHWNTAWVMLAFIDKRFWSWRRHWWNFRARVQVGHWTCITPWESVKIRKMFSLVCGFFCILMLCANIFSFPDLQAAHKYKNLPLKLKLEKNIWLPILCLNPYNFFSVVVQHRRLNHGILPEFDLSLHPRARWRR